MTGLVSWYSMKFKTIDSKDNKKYKLFKSLYLKKNRDKYKLFLLEGKKLLSEVLNENLDIENIICTEKFVENFEFKENFLDKVIILSEKLFKNLTELTNSEGVITIVNYIEEKKISSKNIICLENVSDPGNFGTIIRTANAFGINDILTINCVDKYNSKVLRATMGAIFRTNIIDCKIEKKKELQSGGYRLISTTLSKNSKFLEEFTFDGKNIVVMGNEASGVSEEMLNISNEHLKIDMDNSMESLNVSIAAALIMYKIFKG